MAEPNPPAVEHVLTDAYLSLRTRPYGGPCKLCGMPVDAGAQLFAWISLFLGMLALVYGTCVAADLHGSWDTDKELTTAVIIVTIIVILSYFAFGIGSILLLVGVLKGIRVYCVAWIWTAGFNSFAGLMYVVLEIIAEISWPKIVANVLSATLYPFYGIWLILGYLRFLKDKAEIKRGFGRQSDNAKDNTSSEYVSQFHMAYPGNSGAVIIPGQAADGAVMPGPQIT